MHVGYATKINSVVSYSIKFQNAETGCASTLVKKNHTASETILGLTGDQRFLRPMIWAVCAHFHTKLSEFITYVRFVILNNNI